MRTYEITIREYSEGREVGGGRFILQDKRPWEEQETILEMMITQIKKHAISRFGKWLRIKTETEWSKEERERNES